MRTNEDGAAGSAAEIRREAKKRKEVGLRGAGYGLPVVTIFQEYEIVFSMKDLCSDLAAHRAS